MHTCMAFIKWTSYVVQWQLGPLTQLHIQLVARIIWWCYRMLHWLMWNYMIKFSTHVFISVLHVFHSCNTCVYTTPVLHMYFNTCNICVGYTPILMCETCITAILYMYYRCMNYICNTHKHHTCITRVS